MKWLTDSRFILWLAGFLLAIAGIAWLLWSRGSMPEPMPEAGRVDVLMPGAVATMDSPAFDYSPGWQVTAAGADPSEPAAPWNEPAGVVEFDYTGDELALMLGPGDYWGYLYVTVDGAPASELPVIGGNVNSQNDPAGYKPLYLPEHHVPLAQWPVWQHVHRSVDRDRDQTSDQTGTETRHHVRIEVWRAWGQLPLRGVAVDRMPPEPRPLWPGVLMLVSAVWLIVAAWIEERTARQGATDTKKNRRPKIGALRILADDFTARPIFYVLWLAVVTMIAAGIIFDRWWLVLSATAVLGLIALARPSIWVATLLFGLPFYYSFTLPLLPIRSFSLIEVGIFGGLVVWLISGLMTVSKRPTFRAEGGRHQWVGLALAAVISWALIAMAAAVRTDVALYEWRTVFLAAGAFALLLGGVLATSRAPLADRRLLLFAWLAGATLVAASGIWQFASHSMLIEAEGVTRVRAFYGSPNNLALYLERSLAVALALALFTRQRRSQAVWLVVAALQGLALLLTFSKGALFLGVPALLATLWLGGLWLLRQRDQSTRPLWLLAGLALLGLLILTPFLGTERFTRLLDLSQGTGFLRLQLWRSSWQMALDHLPFGVGPDNFLYTYRSSYILPEAWQEPNLNHPHNWGLDWWTRLGLPGLALGLAFWGAGIAVLWRHFRTGTGEMQIWALGFLAATAAILAHGLIDLSYALPDLMIVWVLLFFLIDGTVNPKKEA